MEDLHSFGGVGLGVLLVLDLGVNTLQPGVGSGGRGEKGQNGGDGEKLHGDKRKCVEQIK